MSQRICILAGKPATIVAEIEVPFVERNRELPRHVGVRSARVACRPAFALRRRTGRLRRSDRMNSLLRQVVPPVALALVVISVWQGVVSVFGIQKYLLPSPWQVATALAENRSELAGAAWFTVKAALGGLVASTIAGVTVAILFSQSAMLRRSAYPYAIYLQTAPIVAIAPLIAVWIGEGIMAIIVVVFIISLFPVITNSTDGLLAIPNDLQELFRLNRATRWQTLWMLQLPQALPRIITGVKISSAMVVLGATVGRVLCR